MDALEKEAVQSTLVHTTYAARSSQSKAELPQPAKYVERIEYMLTNFAKSFHVRILDQDGLSMPKPCNRHARHR